MVNNCTGAPNLIDLAATERYYRILKRQRHRGAGCPVYRIRYAIPRTSVLFVQNRLRRSGDETTWSCRALGFISWLLALGIPFLLYGSNTLFFLLYTGHLPLR